MRVFQSEPPADHSLPRCCCWPKCPRPAELDAICVPHALAVSRQVRALGLAFAAEPEPAPLRTEGVVYFIRLGDRVKIGFSRNLATRLAALPHEEVLAVIRGTPRDEKRCHAAFAHLRQTGEWFRAEPDLLSFIRDIAARSLTADDRERHNRTDPVCPD